MKKILTLLTAGTCCLASLVSTAQTPASEVNGSVTDGGETLTAATVSLLKAADSSLVKMYITDPSGHFSLQNLSAGDYLLRVSAVGHESAYSRPFLVKTGVAAIQLPPITLPTLSKKLAAVTVTGRKPMIEQKIDRMVVNVDASVTNVGATALEVLEKSPGVTVDKDGNISLKGKQGVTVMLDGRPTYLNAADLASYLKSLPASQLEQIEIMTNPSAKYDAAGNAGIINIKTRKNKQKGFNGNLSLNYRQGYFWSTNNSLNLNYRTGRFNLFANGSASRWNNYQQLDILRKFKDPDTKEIDALFQQKSVMHHNNGNYSVKVGADYYLDKKTTLGIVTTGFLRPERTTSENTSYLENASGVVDSIVYAVSDNHNKWKNGSVNLNFSRQFDSTGRELTADLDYVTYQAPSDQTFETTSYNPDWVKRNEQMLQGDLPVHIDIYAAKIDYTRIIWKGIKLETGAKSSYVKTDNAANYFNIVDGTPEVDYDKTNRFLYKENINAAYVNFSKQFKKIGVQAGLRYENTSYTGNQFGNPQRPDSAFRHNYGSLFPTVYLSYAADKNNQFTVSYGRRIDRPDYQDLNPFLFFLDQFTYQAGNPFLRPQFSDNIELSHTFKSFLTTTLNYSHTRDFMTETFEQGKAINGGSNDATIVRRGNIGERQNAGIAVSAQVPVGNWWTAILYANGNYNKFSGPINGEYVNIDATNLTLNLNNQFRFDHGWGGELSGFYRTKGVEGQILLQPMGQLNAGISKEILKGKASLKCNVRDIFFTMRPEGDINFENTLAHFKNTRDSRVANLSFVFRFGKPIKNSRSHNRAGGAGDEQERVKAGGNN